MADAIDPPALAPIVGQDDYSDSLTGSGGADLMQGLSGNDALDGSAGDDDRVVGGLGDDYIDGGTDIGAISYLRPLGGFKLNKAKNQWLVRAYN